MCFEWCYDNHFPGFWFDLKGERPNGFDKVVGPRNREGTQTPAARKEAP